jgi:hypothetical protein
VNGKGRPAGGPSQNVDPSTIAILDDIRSRPRGQAGWESQRAPGETPEMTRGRMLLGDLLEGPRPRTALDGWCYGVEFDDHGVRPCRCQP